MAKATEYAFSSYQAGRFPAIGVECEDGKWVLTDHAGNRLCDKAQRSMERAMTARDAAIAQAKQKMWRDHSVAV